MTVLHLVTPDLFDRPGGIARITRSTSLAMAEWAAERGVEMHVHVLHDRPGAERSGHVPEAVRFHGYAGHRSALTANLAGACVSRDVGPFVFAHVNLATTMLAWPHVRYAIVAHGIEVWSPLSWWRRHALQRASRVWAVSDYTARIVRANHGVDGSRVRKLANCLDPFWTAPAPVVSEGPSFFLLVSRLSGSEEQKGIGHTIAAFSRAADRGWIPADCELHVIGEGSDRQAYESDARRSPFGARIRFLGRVDDEVLQREYAQCLAFVLPSAKEGFGLVFLEAMANGKAVIAAAAGASPEVVANESTGLIVPYGDIESIATAMSRLARDAQLRDALGARARDAVKTTFGFDHYRSAVHAELDALGAR